MLITSTCAPLGVSLYLSPFPFASSSSPDSISSPLFSASLQSSLLLGGVLLLRPHMPPLPTHPLPPPILSLPPPSSNPPGRTGVLYVVYRFLAVWWALPWRRISHMSHYGLCLILWCLPPPQLGWCALYIALSCLLFPSFSLTPALSCGGEYL